MLINGTQQVLLKLAGGGKRDTCPALRPIWLAVVMCAEIGIKPPHELLLPETARLVDTLASQNIPRRHPKNLNVQRLVLLPG